MTQKRYIIQRLSTAHGGFGLPTRDEDEAEEYLSSGFYVGDAEQDALFWDALHVEYEHRENERGWFDSVVVDESEVFTLSQDSVEIIKDALSSAYDSQIIGVGGETVTLREYPPIEAFWEDAPNIRCPFCNEVIKDTATTDERSIGRWEKAIIVTERKPKTWHWLYDHCGEYILLASNQEIEGDDE